MKARGEGGGNASEQWGNRVGGEEEEEGPCREREINPSPPPEGAGLSLRRRAGAKGEPVTGRRAAGGPGTCCRERDGAEAAGPAPHTSAQLRGSGPRDRSRGERLLGSRLVGSDGEKECFKKKKKEKKNVNNNHKIVIMRRKEQAPSQQAGSGIGSEGKERSESGDNTNIQIGYSTIKPGALIAVLRAPLKAKEREISLNRKQPAFAHSSLPAGVCALAPRRALGLGPAVPSALWSPIHPCPLPTPGFSSGRPEQSRERPTALRRTAKQPWGEACPKPGQAREDSKAEPLQVDVPRAPFRSCSCPRL